MKIFDYSNMELILIEFLPLLKDRFFELILPT